MRVDTFVDAIFAPGAHAGTGWPALDHLHGIDPSRHPFWEFDSGALQGSQVIFCTVALTFAGILCSAGGIGGGGVYVTVLMVAGALSPHDAVPLSKAIVFFGSMSSLVLNLRKQSATDGTRKALIDYNICRLVVPASLIGTLFGVLLNRYTSGSVIVFVLSAILVVMTWTTTRTAYSQYLEEEEQEQATRRWQPNAPQEESGEASGGDSGDGSNDRRSSAEGGGEAAASETDRQHELRVKAFAPAAALKESARHVATRIDVAIGLGLLVTVVFCGVLRFHADGCHKFVHQEHGQMWSKSGSAWQACHHPVINIRGLGDSLERSMSGPDAGQRLFFGVLFVPFIACLGAMLHYGRACVTQEAWPAHEVFKYQAVAACTGCLAGLVGIGGGLIFSPFFLMMGVEPAVAVATSSTCVIFTSSSTTFQYLFTDRIIMSLTLVYGIVNLCASYAGTSLVHILQDHCSARRSRITAIVAAGVAVSAVLSLVKLVTNEATAAH